ncbi:MAG: RcpC/CpaB family pilus assembly protein [Marmoricola sp.]
MGSFVTPGSHVAIYNTVEAPGNRNIKSTSVLLDDVLVIAVGAQPLMGQDANPDEAASGSSSTVTITVAVTPSDSVRLVHGIQTGSIYAGLRGTDAQVRQGEQINDLNVNQASGGAR